LFFLCRTGKKRYAIIFAKLEAEEEEAAEEAEVVNDDAGDDAVDGILLLSRAHCT
jgi:hypothetical protein